MVVVLRLVVAVVAVVVKKNKMPVQRQPAQQMK
jgi:hypothetical protein